MNWHEVIDERNLEMDRVIAGRLRRDPSGLQPVVSRIERLLADPDLAPQSRDDLTEWLDIIRKRGLPGVLEMLEDGGETAMRLRQSSPFAPLMPQDERRRILSKYEARRPRTHLAGV